MTLIWRQESSPPTKRKMNGTTLPMTAKAVTGGDGKGKETMIKAFYHGFEVRRVVEFLPDGKVRIDQARRDGGTITINVDPAEIELFEVSE